MDWQYINWDALERIRRGFLVGTAGQADYWRREEDLDAYDRTFGRRIAWKWQFVLGELKRRGWLPPAGPLTDWGCGSGIAAREFLNCFGQQAVSSLSLWDRSSIAMQFAAGKIRQAHPGLNVRGLREGEVSGGTLLVSHVLGELTKGQTSELVRQAQQAAAVIFVEPGTYDTSRALIAVRESLRSNFQIVAPCTHQAVCGLLSPENERHWCHHFATPPQEVHTDGDWVKFGRMMGIDMRSLPLSFMVLDRRAALPLPGTAVRVIGRARMYRAYAMLLGCEESGVRDYRFMKRHGAEAFRLLKRDEMPSLQLWTRDGLEITDIEPL